MSEWWTYRLGDFLMFTPRTYTRLFEQYNRDVWPLHLLAVAIGVAIVVLVRRGQPRIVAALLAVVWVWVAWAFFFERYSAIHTYANWFGGAFVVEAVLLVLECGDASRRSELPRRQPRQLALPRWTAATCVAALQILPLLTARREVFGIAPDPTALGTIAVLIAVRARWWLYVIPILWCVVSGATLVAMASR